VFSGIERRAAEPVPSIINRSAFRPWREFVSPAVPTEVVWLTLVAEAEAAGSLVPGRTKAPMATETTPMTSIAAAWYLGPNREREASDLDGGTLDLAVGAGGVPRRGAGWMTFAGRDETALCWWLAGEFAFTDVPPLVVPLPRRRRNLGARSLTFVYSSTII